MKKTFDYSFVRAVKTLGLNAEEFERKFKMYKSREKGMEKILKLLQKCRVHYPDVTYHDKIRFVETIMRSSPDIDNVKCGPAPETTLTKEPVLTKEVYSQIFMLSQKLKTSNLHCGTASIGDIVKVILQNVMSLGSLFI